jgi:hypothetical protein
MIVVQLSKSNDGIHKYVAYVSCGCNGEKLQYCKKKKTVRFGAKNYNDFIIYNREKHKEKEQKKELYIKRHEKNEDWTITGIETSGFWSRWILWNKPTLKESIDDTERRFNIKIIT